MRFEYGVIAAVGALVFASATAQTTHSPAALAEDLDQFLQVVESTHPDIGYTASLAELRAKKDEIRSGLAQPLDARNAWLRFARLNPLFRDAHVGLQYPVNEFTAYRQSGGAVFPLPVHLDAEDRLLVSDTPRLPEGIAAHDEIMIINDQPVQDFLREAMPLMRGETRAIQALVLARSFSAYYWCINGAQPSYRVAVRKPRGTTTYVDLPVLSDPTEAAMTSESFAYERIHPQVGYLRVSSFDIGLQEPFRSFLDASFGELKRSGIRRLIIDIRDNPGGAQELSDMLLRRLTDRPVRQASSLRARITEDNRSIAPSATTGDVVTIEYDEWLDPAPAEDRFAGETVLLLGKRTYSQAIVFGATFQDFQLGKLVGEPTDGWANQTGQVQFTALSHTGLPAAAPIYIIHRPIIHRSSGDQRADRLRPDIEVTSADPASAVNRAMQLLIQ